MSKLIFLFLMIAFTSGCYQHEIILPETKPEKEGISSEKLNLINPVMKAYIDENKMPGLITMVARHGKIVQFEKYGDMGIGQPMQLDAIFRIASMTKPITSVAIMMLYDEGKFNLDDPVASYIPEFKDLRVFSNKDKNGIHVEDQKMPMTIRNLLTHTSGFASGGENSPVDSMYRTANLSGGTLKDMIQELAKIPLKYQPGTRWQYGRSSDVLAYLVEVISGKPLNIFVKERIFSPLHMVDTDYSVPDDKLSRVSKVYGLANHGFEVLTDPEINNVSDPVKFISGNGGLLSTTRDYMIFLQMLLNKGIYNGERVLKSTTVNLMTSNQISNPIMPDDDFLGPLMKGMGFGLGFAIGANNTGSKESYWWSGSANTYFFVDPKEELILILMAQCVPNYFYPVFKEFRELVYQAIIE